MAEAIIITKDEHDSILDMLKTINTKLDQQALPPEERFLDNEQFLFKMGVSKRTAQKWRDEGAIAFTQIGKKIYYKAKDVDELLHKFHRSAFSKTFIRKKI